RSSYSSYSSSSRPRYTMVFFINEGDIPSPVVRQRSAWWTTRTGTGAPTGPRSPVLSWAWSAGSRVALRWAIPEERPADAYRRGPGSHTDLQVLRHAHRALLETKRVGQ